MSAVITAPAVVWISVADAAGRLSVTTGRVYHLISDGRLRTQVLKVPGDLQHPRHVHVRSADVEAYRRYQRALQGGKGRRALLYPGRVGQG